jgi:hypothetical protein
MDPTISWRSRPGRDGEGLEVKALGESPPAAPVQSAVQDPGRETILHWCPTGRRSIRLLASTRQ